MIKIFSLNRRWEAYCGYSVKECEQIFVKALKNANLEASISDFNNSKVQKFMLGSKEISRKLRIIVKGAPFDVVLISATGDPVFWFFMNFGASAEAINTTKTLCLISIYPINDSNKRYVNKALQSFKTFAPKPPWLIDHPRFNLSKGLNYINKAKWSKV